ncbi:MAG: TonB-dependent receptor [Gemmatimonadetes bacterium]|nr:TonB-dependent receptor [Gemmatimonadota bacterium]
MRASWATLLLGLIGGPAIVGHPEILAGQEPPSPDSVVSLRELIVSATRSQSSVGEVPVNVTVVTREQLRLSAAQTLQDVLQEVPGLNFRFPFAAGVAHPSWQAVTLRGLGGTAASRTLVLVDGVPLNDPYFGWVRWSQIPVEVIDRVEIVRGGATVSWGSQSLAGVVHVITRSPRRGGFSAGAQGGNLSTFRGDAMASFGGDRVHGYVAGEFFDSDGYTLTEPSQRGLVDIPSASQHTALRGKVEIDVSDRVRLRAQGNYFDQDKDNATPQRFNTTEAGFGQLGATIAAGDGSTLDANLYVQSQDYLNQFSSVEAGRADEEPSINQDVPSSGVGANLVWDKPGLGDHSLTFGADFLSATGDANELFIWDGSAFERERATGGDQTLFGFFAQDRIRIGDDIQLHGGLRLDVWRQSSGFRHVEVIADGEVLTDDTFEDRSGTRLSHNLGFLAPASDAVAVRGGFYSGLRVPTLNELYKPFRAAGGVVTESSEALDPERMIGVEVGLDIQPDPTFLVRLTGFWNRVTDAITDVTIQEATESGVIQPCGFVSAGGVCRQRDNVGTIRSIGLETELELRPSGAWLFAANYQFNPTEITEAPGRDDLVGNDVQGSPEHRAMLRVGHVDPTTLELVATGRFLGDRFDNDLNTGEIASSFLVDLRARRQITQQLDAFISLQNAFDTVAEMSHDAGGFIRVAAPRTFVGGLRVRVTR